MDKRGLAGFEILLLIGAILVIAGVAYKTNPQFSPFISARPICTDSDGGINLFMQGEACSGNECETDFCDNNILTEYYCDRDRIKKIIQNCELGCGEGRCFPLEANITNPIDNETINTNFTILKAETNGNAVCEFYLSFAGRNGGGGSRPREMENTGARIHSQLVEGLRETNESESYSLGINCKNTISRAEDRVYFFVDI